MKFFPADPILFVDDETDFLLSIELTMSSRGINNIETCSDSREVMDLLKRRKHSLVVLDINMPYISGAELLPQIVRDYPETHVIVITAVNDVESAVKCMREGAFDYVVKPVDETRIVGVVRRGLQIAEMRNENEMLRHSLLHGELDHPEAFKDIVTRSPSMMSLFRYMEAIARTNLPVLITGETGTGKELFAKAIHTLSGRKGELVPVNVAGVDDHLFTDTLFGHKKGAFTGAEMERKGLIEKAQDGTLFLDEIGDLSVESQVKLLRLLQDGQYYPLGSDTPRLSNARVVVATHRDIDSMQAQNSFRQDLYYRLRAHHIPIPPLRERKEDIPLLADHFIVRAAETLGKKRPTAPRELYPLLSNYPFPGNVRELEGVLYDAISVHQRGVLSLEAIRKRLQLGQEITTNGSNVGSPSDEPLTIPAQFPTMKEAEDFLIEEALRRAEGNQTLAAEMLGLSRRALNNRLKRSESDKKSS